MYHRIHHVYDDMLTLIMLSEDLGWLDRDDHSPARHPLLLLCDRKRPERVARGSRSVMAISDNVIASCI